MNSYSLKRRTHRCKQETNLTGYRCRLRWKYRILVKMIFVPIMLSVIFLAITSFCSRMLSICRGLLPSMNFKVYWKVNQKNQRKIKHFSSFVTKKFTNIVPIVVMLSQLRERKKKLAVEDTEMVAYVDASRRCVTDTMGQKVWLWWRLWCWFHSFQPTFSFLRIFEEIYWSTGHEWRMKLWRKETIWWGSKPPPHFIETHFKMASWEPYCPVFCSVITE